MNVTTIDADARQTRADPVAVEEPLEIRLAWGPPSQRQTQSVSITMRTPGDDFELAAGLMFAEGVIESNAAIETMSFCGPAVPGQAHSNIVKLDLHPELTPQLEHLARTFTSTSACGICGKASLDALSLDNHSSLSDVHLSVRADVIHNLPRAMHHDQSTFALTGGLHAAALFDAAGELIALREDVGRHNAVDKLVGSRLLGELLPADQSVLVVSGRTSFEILQKALVARIPVVVAVGAPSSLAVELASRFGMTLIGFARNERFNIYSGAQRVV